MDNMIWGSDGQLVSSDQHRMAIAQALLQQGQQPANNIAQGAANAISSFAGGYMAQQARNPADPFSGSGVDAFSSQAGPSQPESALLPNAGQAENPYLQKIFGGGF
ncbi:hypothetical protein [Asaia astilbis]|uniref:hypothetical protein n=1 Tax=Asaia astilbis TaxID=610244 RepID=UPI000470F711|nr:hypothetical protein [Asaia astilbis]